MLMRVTTAGRGDYYGACYGHPNDPRNDGSAFEDEWFAIEESERIIRLMKDALKNSDTSRFHRLQAELVSMNTGD